MTALVTRLIMYMLAGAAGLLVSFVPAAEYYAETNELIINVEKLSLWVSGMLGLATTGSMSVIPLIWRSIAKKRGGLT